MKYHSAADSAQNWIKSSYSMTNGNCIEARRSGRLIEVRDSQNPAGAVLAFGSAQWDAFIGHIRNEAF